MSDEATPEDSSSEDLPGSDTESSSKVDLIDALPNRPLTTREWKNIGAIDAVLNQRQIYPMNKDEKRPNADDDLGSFLLEIEGIGWRGYHYTPENREWNITFTGEHYEMILDMHEEYVLPHMLSLLELEEEAEEKKKEILEQSERSGSSESDSGSPVDEPTTSNQDSTNEDSANPDSGATASVE